MDDNKWKKDVMHFYAKTTAWVLFPLLLALFLGKLVVKDTGRDSLFFLFVIIGFLITIYGIYREIKIYKKNLDIEDKEKDGNK